MLWLFTMFSFSNSLSFLLLCSYVQTWLILNISSFLFLGSALWLLLPSQMERRAKRTSKLNQTLSHLHLFVIFNWQILWNFDDVLFIKGELSLIFNV